MPWSSRNRPRFSRLRPQGCMARSSCQSCITECPLRVGSGSGQLPRMAAGAAPATWHASTGIDSQFDWNAHLLRAGDGLFAFAIGFLPPNQCPLCPVLGAVLKGITDRLEKFVRACSYERSSVDFAGAA